VEPGQEVDPRIHDGRHRRRRAGNVDRRWDPVDRDGGRRRVDIVDFEVARPRDPLRGERIRRPRSISRSAVFWSDRSPAPAARPPRSLG
jgi:hypothetical protein